MTNKCDTQGVEQVSQNAFCDTPLSVCSRFSLILRHLRHLADTLPTPQVSKLFVNNTNGYRSISVLCDTFPIFFTQRNKKNKFGIEVSKGQLWQECGN